MEDWEKRKMTLAVCGQHGREKQEIFGMFRNSITQKSNCSELTASLSWHKASHRCQHTELSVWDMSELLTCMLQNSLWHSLHQALVNRNKIKMTLMNKTSCGRNWENDDYVWSLRGQHLSVIWVCLRTNVKQRLCSRFQPVLTDYLLCEPAVTGHVSSSSVNCELSLSSFSLSLHVCFPLKQLIIFWLLRYLAAIL